MKKTNHRGTEGTEEERREGEGREGGKEDGGGDDGRDDDDLLTREIIAGAIEVHRFFGPGLLESIYEKVLAHELELRGLPVVCQQPVPVHYKGKRFEDFRLDLLVNGEVVVELKTVDRLVPVHTAQMLTYLKLTGLRRGLLLNFKGERLIDGIKRVIL